MLTSETHLDRQVVSVLSVPPDVQGQPVHLWQICETRARNRNGTLLLPDQPAAASLAAVRACACVVALHVHVACVFLCAAAAHVHGGSSWRWRVCCVCCCCELRCMWCCCELRCEFWGTR